jgi:predicted CoA-substrate-specific enzyme activase
MRIGIDIGSTTIKCVVLDDQGHLIHKSYERHFAMITEKTREVIRGLIDKFNITEPVVCAVSGSAGMGLAEKAGLPFVQEVYATKVAMSHRLPEADVVIELGGEDAKILFLQGNLEVRMNGTCAGGTGAFADQMASLMQIETGEMNELAKQHEKIYSIASRCGVFAKTDIQPLLNQGARKEDISASIFYAIVNQTITGLAQGHPIEGTIVYLGGPLTFLSELRKAFDKTLGCEGICPADSLVFVALSAAYYAQEKVDLEQVYERIGEKTGFAAQSSLRPLFADKAEYEAFMARHDEHRVPRKEGVDYAAGVEHQLEGTHKVLATDEELARWTA